MELSLARDASAVRRARHAVTEYLSTSFSADVVDRARVLVSELVTNALLHGQGAPRLCVEHGHRRVRVEVSDDGPPFPPFKNVENGSSSLGGRLLAAMASQWGIAPSRGSGKTVWFELVEPLE